MPSLSRAGDWPQIHGPQRDGAAVGETLLRTWPEAGPKQVWSSRIGIGYGGAAIANQVVYIFHRQADAERVQAFRLSDGKSLWQRDFPAHYRGGVDRDLGPRCVPVVASGFVIVFGAAGDLHCLQAKSGEVVWSRELYADYRGDLGYFGAGSTPIVVGETVLVNVGGRSNAGIVAVGLKDGKTVWTATDERASYSSPVQAKIGGKSQVVFLTRLNTVGIDPGNGKELFRFEHGKLGPTVNAAVPLVFDDFVFVTSSYRVGARAVTLRDGKATELWSNDESLSSQYNSAVYHQGNLYGIHGREDFGETYLRCVDAKTGKVKWSEESIGVAHLIRASDLLIVVEVDGTVSLVEAKADGFNRLAKHTVTGEVTRALPALADGKLVLRTTAPDSGKLICLQVGK